MTKRLISFAMTILFLCSGCVYIPYDQHFHRVPDDKILASIKEGVTSKEDVLMMLGEPDRVKKNESLFLYWWQEEHGGFGLVLPTELVGLGVVRCTYTWHIEFDENNIVKKGELRKSERIVPPTHLSDEVDGSCELSDDFPE